MKLACQWCVEEALEIPDIPNSVLTPFGKSQTRTKRESAPARDLLFLLTIS